MSHNRALKKGVRVDYRNLGHTGLKVSPLCLGAMMFGKWGNADHDDSIRIIHRALDAGINFIDTANGYSEGESEVIVGKALRDRREGVVLATKVWAPVGPGPNQRGLSRKAIQEQVENSLRRLGTDVIDLYQIHRPDPTTPLEETLSTLNDLVRQFPGTATHLRAPDGGVHRFVNVYLNDEDVRYLGKLDTKVGEGDTVSIVPAVAGG